MPKLTRPPVDIVKRIPDTYELGGTPRDIPYSGASESIPIYDYLTSSDSHVFPSPVIIPVRNGTNHTHTRFPRSESQSHARLLVL